VQGDFQGTSWHFDQSGTCSYYAPTACSYGTWMMSGSVLTVTITQGTCPFGTAGGTLVLQVAFSAGNMEWLPGGAGSTCSPPPAGASVFSPFNSPNGC
jgi:hypothetical protein